MILTLIDYGAGNLASVERAFERLGVQTRRARHGEELNDAEAIVLPGVGHFGALARAINKDIDRAAEAIKPARSGRWRPTTTTTACPWRRARRGSSTGFSTGCSLPRPAAPR